MPREHFSKPIQTAAGDLVPDSVVRLIDPATGTNLATPIFISLEGEETRENPWTSVDGLIDFYLDKPARVKIGVTPPGMEEFYFNDVEVGDPEVYLETLPFAVSGPQVIKAYGSRYYCEQDYAVRSVRISVGTTPAGSDLIVDVNRNGTSMFASAAARPRIVPGAYTALVKPEDVTFSAGDYITVDVDQVGSSSPGIDLTIQIRVERLTS